jgi:hypothetical protein
VRTSPRHGYACEPLERRVLLDALTISWTNRAGAGGTDDEFDDVFGTVVPGGAEFARIGVDRAIEDWNYVLLDAVTQPATLSLTIIATNLGVPGVLGVTDNFIITAGRPDSARVRIDNDAGGLGGWYIDPVPWVVLGGGAPKPEYPRDDGEYTDLVGRFTGTPPPDPPPPGHSPYNYDLYRTVLHEIGHALGIADQPGLLINGFLAPAGTDPLDPSAQLKRFFDPGTTVEATFTTADGLHLYEGPAVPPGYTGPTHPDDLLNSGRTVTSARRQLISDTDVRVLGAAYGYNIPNNRLPSQFNTFYGNLNTDSNVLTIQGDPGNANDNIVIDTFTSGGGVVYIRALVNGTLERFRDAQVDVVVVRGGGGNDTIDLRALPAGNPITILGGEGDDDLMIGAGDWDTNVLSGVSVDGEAGADEVVIDDTSDGPADPNVYTFTAVGVSKNTASITYGSATETMIVNAGPIPDTANVNATPAGTTLTVNAGGGNDALFVGSGDIDTNLGGNVTLAGGLGTDALTFNDISDGPDADTYTLSGTSLAKGARDVAYAGVESLTITGSPQPSAYTITGTAAAAPPRIDPGAATDTIDLVNHATGSPLTLGTSAGNDVVTVNSDAVGAATLLLPASVTLGSLNVRPGGVARLTAAGSPVLETTNALTANGIVEVTAPGGIVHVTGGTLSGSGTLVANVQSAGTIGPGASPGTLAVEGNLTLAPSSQVVAEIAGLVPGTQYDVISVSGVASLAGALSAMIVGGFEPLGSASFGVISAASRLGTFATFIGPPTPAGRTLNVRYGATTVTVAVAPLAPSVPDLLAASDTGRSQTDNVTRDDTPTFGGATADPGSLRLFADGTLVATLPVGVGPFNITSSALTDGARVMTLSLLDADGDESPLSAPLTVTIDTVAPATPGAPDLAATSDTGTRDDDNITRDNTPEFSGTVEADADVAIFSEGVEVGGHVAGATGAYAITTSALSDGVRQVTARATDAAGNVSATSPALAVTIDTAAPTLVGAPAFLYATAPHRLRYAFSENVGETLAIADWLVERLPSTPIPVAVAYHAPTNTATLTFPGPPGILADGRYRATLFSNGVTDLAGNPLLVSVPDADHVMPFIFLTGDANNDGTVNLADFNTLAANFGQSPRDFTQGDFNYDGTVNLTDFNLLASRFGTAVAPASFAATSGLKGTGSWRDLDDDDDEAR